MATGQTLPNRTAALGVLLIVAITVGASLVSRQVGEDGKGGSTRKQVFQLLRGALNTAARRRLIGHNPAALVDAPRHEAKERRALTEAQARRLLTAIRGHRLEALFVLAIGTGMRQGELFGLSWRAFDEAKRTYSVLQQVMSVKGKPVLTERLKSKAARRVFSGWCGPRSSVRLCERDGGARLRSLLALLATRRFGGAHGLRSDADPRGHPG